jgi:DNA (cytosine-5)-methyltransferase 1
VLTSIEVCAGAGGQALGLHAAGFKHVALVEVDRHAAATLRANGQRTGWWAPEAVHETSLIGWEPPSDIGEVTLVAGGVPCPPFSIAGKQLGGDDERDLFPAILDLVEHVDPVAVMVENVRGLLTRKFDTYRSEVLSRLGDLGFEGEWELLEAHDYGVPQLRPRSVLVATRPSVWKYFKWPTPEATRRGVGEALLPLMAADGWELAEEWAAQADDIAPTLVGGSKKHGGADLGPTRAKRAWAERHGVDALGVADSPPQPGFTGMPRLTVQMAAAIQGFPPDWQFEGGKTAQYRQVGNAFPAPVATAVGIQIRKAIRVASRSVA